MLVPSATSPAIVAAPGRRVKCRVNGVASYGEHSAVRESVVAPLEEGAGQRAVFGRKAIGLKAAGNRLTPYYLSILDSAQSPSE